MYKKFNLEEISSIQNNFIPHLYKIIQQERFQGVNDFFKFAFKEGDETFFFERGNVCFKIALEGNMIHMMDEVDKIEVEVPFDNKWGLQDLVKKYIVKKQRQVGQKSIEQILMDSFVQGTFSQILGKPYLVYDIETSLIGDRLEDTEFYIWYSMEEDGDGKMHYECIMPEDLESFVEKMLQFEGYIVWFNQMRFDNPVCIYNVWGTQEQIDILNQKSIDLYVFVQQITWKRMWLNKISEALIGVSKTLDSWANVEMMWKARKQSGDNSILKEIQKYCKNDVRMTALLFLYFLHFKKIYMDGAEYSYNIAEFIDKSNNIVKKIETGSLQNQSLL